MPATYRPGGALPRGTVTVTSVTTRTVRAGIVNRAAVPSGRNANASGAITPGAVGDVSVTRVSRSAGATPRCVLAGALFATNVIEPPQEFGERGTGYRMPPSLFEV